jgi:hypothetical protein
MPQPAWEAYEIESITKATIQLAQFKQHQTPQYSFWAVSHE